MKIDNPAIIGNMYGAQFGPSYAGNVYAKNGISPALMTMCGGAGSRES